MAPSPALATSAEVTGPPRKRNRKMKTYYAIVNVAEKRLGTYVVAEDVAAAFRTATAKFKRRNPRLDVVTIAVQEMADT